MTTHNSASFYTATLKTLTGDEDWLLPARNLAAAQMVAIPYGCRIEFHKFIWLELEGFYDGPNGYTFVFYHNGLEWRRDPTNFGYDYLYERYIHLINEYERDRE